ncbi:aspartic proteinase nepenthesin-1-like [Aegilops tauschii subsp. strangulata]|uniref:Aspartic proteinase nepenthesin-1 n=1 Tax=Aegilops tauschii TaxID=37682 RepID=M8C1Q0_AEGTA
MSHERQFNSTTSHGSYLPAPTKVLVTGQNSKISHDYRIFPCPSATSGKHAVVAAVAVPNLRFGCGMLNTGIFKSNESGITCFGRGPLSLPSQLKIRNFSYCFMAIVESRASPVFLGGELEKLEAHATGPIQSTRSPQALWEHLWAARCSTTFR